MTHSLIAEAVRAVEAELERRREGQEPDRRFDPVLDVLLDLQADLAAE